MWRKAQKLLGILSPAILLALLLVILISLVNRWDSVVAITVIPAWAWAMFGISLSLITWGINRDRTLLILALLWLVTGLFFSGELKGVARGAQQFVFGEPRLDSENQLRVVNLNAGGNPNTIRALVSLDPDIVTVQQAPQGNAGAKIRSELADLDYSIHQNRGLAIIAKGEFLSTLTAPQARGVHARLRTKRNRIVDVTCLGLPSLLPTVKLWNPEAWKTLAGTRKQNRRQLRAQLGENQISQAAIVRVVGGGFNTPPGDDVFRPLESNDLLDTFDAAGVGSGNTFPAKFPLLRLDQIWVSLNVTPVRTDTQSIPGAERRAVVVDLDLR